MIIFENGFKWNGENLLDRRDEVVQLSAPTRNFFAELVKANGDFISVGNENDPDSKRKYYYYVKEIRSQTHGMFDKNLINYSLSGFGGGYALTYDEIDVPVVLNHKEKEMTFSFTFYTKSWRLLDDNKEEIELSGKSRRLFNILFLAKGEALTWPEIYAIIYKERTIEDVLKNLNEHHWEQEKPKTDKANINSAKAVRAIIREIKEKDAGVLIDIQNKGSKTFYEKYSIHRDVFENEVVFQGTDKTVATETLYDEGRDSSINQQGDLLRIENKLDVVINSLIQPDKEPCLAVRRPASMSSFLGTTSVDTYVEREELLLQIKKKLDFVRQPDGGGKGIVILSGMGGQGKTEAALEYAYNNCGHKCDSTKCFYSRVFYLTHNNEAKTVIDLINQYKQYHWFMANGNLQLEFFQEDTLIIIDNFTAHEVFDEREEKFLRSVVYETGKAHVIITTRNSFADTFYNNFVIHVDEFVDDSLLYNVFLNNYTRNGRQVDAREIEYVKEICGVIGNVLGIELVAKQLQMTTQSEAIAKFCKTVRKSIKKLTNAAERYGPVRISHNEKRYTSDPYSIFKSIIFDEFLQKKKVPFSFEQLKILYLLSHATTEGLTETDICILIEKTKDEARYFFLDLCTEGWIRQSSENTVDIETKFSMHPLIAHFYGEVFENENYIASLNNDINTMSSLKMELQKSWFGLDISDFAWNWPCNYLDYTEHIKVQDKDSDYNDLEYIMFQEDGCMRSGIEISDITIDGEHIKGLLPFIVYKGDTVIYGWIELGGVAQDITEKKQYLYTVCHSIKRSIPVRNSKVILLGAILNKQGNICIKIPDKIEGIPVEIIPQRWMHMQLQSTNDGMWTIPQPYEMPISIHIPRSIKIIEKGAFCDCSGLTEVTLSEGIIEIGDCVFSKCNKLERLYIPSSVRRIGQHIIGGQENVLNRRKYDNNLINIQVADGNSTFNSEGACNAIVRTATQELILGCNKTKIPPDIKIIGDYAFAQCREIKKVNLPEQIMEIGSYAFEDCSGLVSVELPDSLVTIRDHAFSGCSNLKSIVIPKNVKKIDAAAFSGCCNLERVVISEGVEEIESLAFCECHELKTVVIPSSVTRIGNDAFSGCDQVEEVSIAEKNQFYTSSNNCNAIIETSTNKLIFGINTPIIPSNATVIGQASFRHNLRLKSIIIPSHIEEIESWAFSMCDNLENVTFSKGICRIDEAAFWHCPGIKRMIIPNSVIKMGNIIRGNNNLEELVVDKENTVYDSREDCNAVIETITSRLVMGCSRTVIPNSVKEIANNAFNGCESLRELTIPASVTKIGEYIIQDGNYLEKLIVSPQNTVYDSRENCNAIIETETDRLILGTVNTIIPDTVKEIGSNAFVGCSGLAELTIPDSVTAIGEHAFSFAQPHGIRKLSIPRHLRETIEYLFDDLTLIVSGVNSIYDIVTVRE